MMGEPNVEALLDKMLGDVPDIAPNQPYIVRFDGDDLTFTEVDFADFYRPETEAEPK